MSSILLLDEGLNVDFQEIFYSPSEADEIFEELLKIPFYTPILRIYGREYHPKRKVFAYGDEGLNYSFSGTCVVSTPWSSLMRRVKADVERNVGCTFNYALLNLYEDGRSKISDHKDVETSLDFNIPTATLSFGSERTIQFKRPNCRGTDITLNHGSMYVMHPPTNQLFTHGIPAEPECKTPRISITFRRIDCSDEPPTKKPKIDSSNKDDSHSSESVSSDRVDHMIWQMNAMESTFFDLSFETLLGLREFKNAFFIDIRKCVPGKDEVKIPTKSGITMSPVTWFYFTEKLHYFNFLYPTASFIANNKLIVMNQEDRMQLIQLGTLRNGDIQQKNFYSLTSWEVQRLQEQENTITNCVIECLWCEQLVRKFILHQPKELIVQNRESVINIFLELAECHLESKLQTVFYCEGCVVDSLSQLNHDCIYKTPSEKYHSYGEKALLLMDPVVFAKELYESQHFNTNFLKTLNMNEIKKLIFKEKSNL